MTNQERIVQASIELFMQYGFKTVTLDDIARRAGVSKKTLYLDFESKDKIVLATVRAFHRQLRARIDAVTGSCKNAVECLTHMTDVIASLYKQVNPLSMMEMQRFYPAVFKIFQDEVVDSDRKALEKTLQQGIEEGYFRQDINVTLVALFRMETCMMYLQPGTMVTAQFDPYVACMQVTDLFLHSILTPKGLRLYQKYRTTN